MTAVLPSVSPLIAMAAPPAQGVGPLIQFIPFVLVLAIFYFLILAPMKRRQKRVEEFQAGLKTGDKVVTTGGLYGAVARVDEHTVHLQVAANVRVEVARSAIAGYQGQPPVVAEGN